MTYLSSTLRTLFTAIFSVSLFGVFAGADAQTPDIADADVVVMSHWSVDLPFSMDESDPLKIGEVLNPMWVWMQSGGRITSVNGIELGNLNAVRAILRMSTELTDQTQLLVNFGTGTDANGEPIEELAILPVIQDTVLKNGLHFETIFVGNTWTSTLIGRPETASTDLQVGDRLVSFGGQVFDMRKSVQEIFQRERRKGMMAYEITYMRDDEQRVGSISLHDESRSVEEPVLLANAQSRDLSRLVVMSQWNVRIPMEPDPELPTRVRTADMVDQIEPGDMIASVNGIEIGHINALAPVLRMSTELEDQTGLTVDLGVKKSKAGPVETQRISMPIVQDTVLGNGLRFETVFATYSWETFVTSIPEGAETDLLVGDRIMAYGDGQPINDRTSIKDIIEKDRRKGMEAYQVVVLRDGEFMTCDMVF